MRQRFIRPLGPAFLTGFLVMNLPSIARATVYTSDPNLSDFLSSEYATLSNYGSSDPSTFPAPYTPTNTTLLTGARVYNGFLLSGLPSNNDWILATFPAPVSSIRVFPNIDHFGSAFDGYQYTIEGSNDGVTWTPLFDALSVVGSGEPFTLGSSSGTAPFRVNNVLTTTKGPGGYVGYIADFAFGSAYTMYAFGASTQAIQTLNPDQELSAVAVVPLDTDGDGIQDSIDNCPYTPNGPLAGTCLGDFPQGQALCHANSDCTSGKCSLNQEDTGGVGSGSPPDGIGDACQCGDVNNDGIVNNTDATLIKRAVVDLAPYPGGVTTLPGYHKCQVVLGSPPGDTCNNTQASLIQRAVVDLAPGIMQGCHAATTFP